MEPIQGTNIQITLSDDKDILDFRANIPQKTLPLPSVRKEKPGFASMKKIVYGDGTKSWFPIPASLSRTCNPIQTSGVSALLSQPFLSTGFLC